MLLSELPFSVAKSGVRPIQINKRFRSSIKGEKLQRTDFPFQMLTIGETWL